MSGERNHKYFKDSILNISQATIKGTLYHIPKQKCPVIELGAGTCIGEYITYNDPTEEITNSIINLEHSFNGLDYNQVTTTALVNEQEIEVQVFYFELQDEDKRCEVAGRWSENNEYTCASK